MWIQILVFISGIILLAIFLIIIIKYNKQIEKIDIIANQPLVENDYRKEFTEGYTRGVLKNVKQNKNGTKLIEFYPIDIVQGENVKIPHLQSFIVKDEFFKSFSIGELSDKREIIKTVIRDPSMIPEKLRDTTEGAWAEKEGQLGFLKSTFRSAIPSGDEAIIEGMKDWARGEMTRVMMSKIKEEVANTKNIISPQNDIKVEEKK